jgi:hypothetical protein
LFKYDDERQNMILLNNCPKGEVEAWGASLLRGSRDRLSCFEEAAQICTKSTYDTFRYVPLGTPTSQNASPATPAPLFSLVRVFRLSRYEDLLPELQGLVDPNDGYWMALMGTLGTEPDWCDRHLSKGHKVIPAGDSQTPMLKAAFAQIGLKQKSGDSGGITFFEGAQQMTRYFHVAQAEQSPYIPAQEEFVKAYQIQSAVGIGSPFLSGAGYLLMAFSKYRIEQSAAEKFAEMSAYMSTLLALYDKPGKLWMTA